MVSVHYVFTWGKDLVILKQKRRGIKRREKPYPDLQK
jgi:hypothetical protein